MSTITGTTINSGITLGTSGNYTSPLTITSTGAVEPAMGDAIFGNSLQTWTIVNQGTVIGGGNGFGVDLKCAGSITNNGGR
jgi:hypothetical protein